MFPSLSIIVPHVLICSHDHLLFSIIIHYYQLQIHYYQWWLFIILIIIIFFIYRLFIIIIILYIYISHIIPYYPHVFLSWLSHGFLLRKKSARSCSWKPPWARPFSARTPWVSRHFPLGKDELFVGTCGKIMGNDGQIWENYGKRWEDME